MRIMGLDMGTSGCKAVVFNEQWQVVCQAYREYSLYFPGEGMLELDPELVWEKICEVISEANEKTDAPVEALAVSSVGDVIIPLGEDGSPVRNSIIDFDFRGTDEMKRYAQDFGIEALFNITGMPPLFINSLAKILWIKNREEHIYNKVARWATYEDFIVERLGAGKHVSYSNAARTMLFDIRKKDWAQEVLSAVPMGRENLPVAVESGQIIGQVEKGLAEKLGFGSKVSVCSGAHDMVCAAIGAGLNEDCPELAVDIAGTIEGLVVSMKEANTDKNMLDSLFSCYPAYKGYVTFGINLTAGCILRWYRDVIAKDEYEQCGKDSDFFHSIIEKINTNEPGSVYCIPHFSGSGNPYFDPNAKGAFYGLTLDCTRDDIVQAIVEALCYEIKLQLEAYEESGININKVRSVGGGAKIDKQIQIKANIIDTEVIKGGVAESSALGAAALAAVALGILENPTDAYQKAQHHEKRFLPDTGAAKKFKKTFEKYKQFNTNIHQLENN